MTIPNEDELLTAVRQAIADTLRQPIDAVSPDSRLGEDLGLESLDYVDVEFALEEQYGIQFLQGSAIEKLAELMEPEAMFADEIITAFGSAVLQLRLPEVDSGRLAEGQPAAGLPAWFSAKTWVRLVQEITTDAASGETASPDGELSLIAWAGRVPGLLGQREN